MSKHPGSETSSSTCKSQVSSIEEKLDIIKYLERNMGMCHSLSNEHKGIHIEDHQRQSAKKSMADITSSATKSLRTRPKEKKQWKDW